MSPALLTTQGPSSYPADAPDAEYVRVSAELALVRVRGNGPSLTASTLVASGGLAGSQTFEALPDPVFGELSGAGLWRAAWAVPLTLVEHDAALALLTAEGLVHLDAPRERLLKVPCHRQLEVRGGRPYLRFVVGIITAALVPVALPSQSFARDLPPCPAPLVQSATPAATATPTDEQPRPDCVPDTAHTPAAAPVGQKPAPRAAPKPGPRPKPPAPKPAVKAPPSAPPKHAPPKHTPPSRPGAHRPHAHPRHHAATHHGVHHRQARPHTAPSETPKHVGAHHPAHVDVPHGPGSAPASPRAVSHASAAPTAPPVRVVTLDSWGVPTELLPVYQAAGNAYGIPWTVLAAVNKIETNYGQNLAVSSAGALGWMQFMPATWSAYGVDANGDGIGDPSDPADAIYAAARYLAAAGGSHDIRKAIFAYNHAGWYVDSVMREAASLETVPPLAVDAMVAVMQASAPVAGDFQVDARSGHGRSMVLSAASALPAVAPVDGRVVAIGSSRSHGRYVTIEDPYGNRYMLAGLGSVASAYPVVGPGHSKAPVGSPAQQRDASVARRLLGLHASEVRQTPLKVGAHVVAGTMLGRLRAAGVNGQASTVLSIRSAGRLIDPAPALRVWAKTAKDAAAPSGALPQGARADAPAGLGAALLLNKTRLSRRVLADTRLTLPAAARRAIETGQVDMRALDTLELLADAKLVPTVSALQGTTLSISAVNGVEIASDGAGARGAKNLTDRLESLQGALRPDRIIRGATQVRLVFASSVRAIGKAATVQAAADRLDRMRLPYVWGGGHATPTPAAPTGLDCSSSVSWVLQRAGFAIPTMTSGEFAHYGEAGPGRYVTIYANSTHVFMAIGGRFFGTSGFGHPSAGTGPAWFTRQPSATYLAGFTQRHLPGL
jgi:hypothetical protein